MSSNALIRTVTERNGVSRKRSRTSRAMSVPLRRYMSVRGTPGGTYEFTRTVTGGLAITNTGFPIGIASYAAATWTVTPNNLYLTSGVAGNVNTYVVPGAADFAALFDKIKIDKVEFTFSQSQTSAANLLMFAIDDNDTTTSPDQIRQMNCKTWQPGSNTNVFKITFYPKYQRIVYYTSLLSSYEPASGYVVSGTDIPHYGLKMGIDLLANSASQLNFAAKIFFKCKEVK